MTHKTFHFTVLFQTATFEMQRYYLFSADMTSFSAYMKSFSAYHFPVLFHKQINFRHRIFFLIYGGGGGGGGGGILGV
jgi:hypothetical protein